MNALKQYKDDLKAMLSSQQTPNSDSPSLDARRIWIAVSIVAVIALISIFAGYLIKGSSPKILNGDPGTPQASTENATNDGSLVIHFKESNRSGSRTNGIVRASTGTLVRVKLLNSLETFDSVPAFVQIVDYGLGNNFFGWTLIGDANGEANVDRIKISFHHAHNPSGSNALDFSGQALSLDGTLGIRAEKVEGFTNRAMIGSAKSAGGNLANSVRVENDLSGLLLRALLSGLQNEISSDLGAAYNRSAALKLNPGQEFFVQLTENF